MKSSVEDQPKATAGAELEAHFIQLVALRAVQGSNQEGKFKLEVSETSLPLFKLKDIICTTDTGKDKSSRVAEILAKKDLKASGSMPMNVVDTHVRTGSHVDIVEFCTEESDSPKTISHTFRKIKTIEEHLSQFVKTQAENGNDLVSLSDWAKEFNRDHKDNPDLHIKMEPAGQDVYIVVQPTKQDIEEMSQGNRELPHHPQFNFSVALEMLAELDLEQILYKEVESNVKRTASDAIAKAEKEFAAAKQRAEQEEKAEIAAKKEIDQDNAFWRNIRVSAKEGGLKGAQAPLKMLQMQIEFMKSSRESAKQATESILRHQFKKDSSSNMSFPKLRKLAGFFYILSNYIASELANWPSIYSSRKNRYLFFIKHKISEIFVHCLSDRDKHLLHTMMNDPAAQREMLVLLAGNETKLQQPMYSYDDKQQKINVTVNDFLQSSLGWKKDDSVCDKLPVAGKLLPPQEPAGLRRKNHRLSRIVIELRWPGEAMSLDQGNQLMLTVLDEAKKFNYTSFLEKSRFQFSSSTDADREIRHDNQNNTPSAGRR